MFGIQPALLNNLKVRTKQLLNLFFVFDYRGQKKTNQKADEADSQLKILRMELKKQPKPRSPEAKYFAYCIWL